MEQIRNRTACIWYLREEHPEICDIPHVLAMVGSNGTALLNTLQKNIITEQMVRSVYDALQRGADNQVSGVLGTLQGAVAQINTPEMMWVFSRPGCPLDVNNPDHPAILTVATNPTTSQTLSPLCSLVITVATKLMNQCLGADRFQKRKKIATVLMFFACGDVRFVCHFCYRDLSRRMVGEQSAISPISRTPSGGFHGVGGRGVQYHFCHCQRWGSRLFFMEYYNAPIVA